MFNLPLGYFFTFTTYGNWLHGDERGSVDRKGTTFESRFLVPDEPLNSRRHAQLKFPPLILTASMRDCVLRAIQEHCAFKGWLLREVNVRTNHVHAVVSARHKPARLLNAIKAYATRALRAADLVSDRPVWTESGSQRYLWKPEDVASACTYARSNQGAPLGSE